MTSLFVYTSEPETGPTPTIIYVSAGSGAIPYYQFYSDSAGNNQISTLYLSNEIYEFRRLNNATTHPFYISDVGYKQPSNTLTFSGDGNHNTGIIGSESFIVNLNNYPVNSSIHYYCTAHSEMRLEFTYESGTESEPDYTTIYVSAGSNVAPYYQFYSDSDGNHEISGLYLAKRKYKFRRLNSATSHPFYISDVGYEQESTTLILSGDGNHHLGITGNQSFIVNLNNYPSESSIYYYTTINK